MARIRYNHNSFSTGIISSKVQGNTEFDRYNNALKTCNNFLIEPTGGLFKRPGTYHIAGVKENGYARIIPFRYSTIDNYICEFGIKYIRFHTKNGTLKKANGDIYEVETIFDSEEAIKSLQYFQSGNQMYLMNTTGVFILTRESASEFQINEMKSFSMPPLTFMNLNPDITFKPDVLSSDTNEFTFIAKDKTKTNINRSDIPGYLVLTYMNRREVKKYYFKLLDEGLVESEEDDAKVFKIKAKLLPELNIETALPNTDTVSNWQLRAFSEKRGYPKKAAIFEGRFFVANNIQYPTAIWGSNLQYNDLFDFTLGTASDAGLQYKMQEDRIDEILWIVSQNKLFIGTAHGIHLAGTTTFNDEAISPLNFRTRLLYAIGASSLQPLVALDAVFFVDASKQRVHEIALDENGAYKASNLSLIADELTESGIIAHTWQQTPINIYWCATKNGNLCALTYLKNNDIMAWTNHKIAGKNAKIEDLATLSQEKNEQVWMIIHREVNGQIERNIEYLYPRYDPLTQEEFKQFYVDSGIIVSKKHTIKDIELSKYEIIHLVEGPQILDPNLDEISDVVLGDHPYLFKIKKCPRGINVDWFTSEIDWIHTVTDGTWAYFFIIGRKEREYDIYEPYFRKTGLSRKPIGYKTKKIINFENLESPNEFYTYRVQVEGDISEIMLNSYVWIYCLGEYSIKAQYYMFKVITINQFSQGTFDIINQSNEPVIFVEGVSDKLIYSLASEGRISSYQSVRDPNYTTITVYGKADEFQESSDDIYINKIYGTSELNNKRVDIFNIEEVNEELVKFKIRTNTCDYGIYDKTIENNGNVYNYFRTIKGLDHLKGQTVSICADGNEIGDQVVTYIENEWIITLPNPAMYVCIGLRYEAEAETVPFQGGSMFGTSVGLIGAQKDIVMYLYHSLGGKYGTSKDNLYNIPYPKKLVFNNPQPLFTGMLKMPMPPSKEIYNRSVYIYDNSVLSLNILSIVQDVSVSDA